MRIEVRKVKPAIYQFKVDQVPKDSRKIRRHLKWGWIDLFELAEITRWPPAQLLLVFGAMDARKWRDGNYWIESTFFLPPEQQQGQPLVHIKAPAFLVSQPHFFVPAGWALAVLGELEKREQARVEQEAFLRGVGAA